VARVARAIVEEKTRIINSDLASYFDNVQHSLLLEKVARRVQDDAVMHLLKLILKSTGKQGVPQGGVSALLLCTRTNPEPIKISKNRNVSHTPPTERCTRICA
jgi:hypothetical protein